MKIRADRPVVFLPAGPRETLAFLRRRRGFEPSRWIEAKVAALESYLSRCGLSAAVLGVSGGVDSAVAAALLARLHRAPGSPLRRVVLLNLPAYGDDGVTGQEGAHARACRVAESVGIPLVTVDLASSMAALRQGIDDGLGVSSSAWAAGQGIAVARTTACYQAAALLSQEGTPGLVVGTINRDEGAYLGYVGKASDGMVDLQLLSDLHKSEVYQVAHLLGVPQSIIDAIPTGDMFDACPDTDVFGAPYDAVELLLLSRTLLDPVQWREKKQEWPLPDQKVWENIEGNLENLHSYNAHKYTVRSPAIHLDLMESQVPGGWPEACSQSPLAPSTVQPEMSAPRVLPGGDRRQWVAKGAISTPARDQDSLIVPIPGLLSNGGVQSLRQALSCGPWQAADVKGNWRGGVVANSPGPKEGVGSWRTTFTDPGLAQALWEALRVHLPPYRLATLLSRFDSEPFPAWRLVGVSPVFRVIAYEAGGLLVPHYDAPFHENGRRRTGMSVVIYLDQGQGGELRFIRDSQSKAPLSQCVLDDWDRTAQPDEVSQVLPTLPGSAVVFDHRLLHDSAPIVSGRKTLLRTDILMEAVG